MSSSPWRTSDSSPARFSKYEDKRLLRNGNSNHHANLDSPSRQLLEEFSRLLIDKDNALQQRLDEQSAEQERLHKAALAEAAVEHERVRQNAERARERVELEIERERKRRDGEELSRLQAERKAKAEREAEERRRVKEHLERQEQERERQQTEEREIQQSRARLEEQKRKDEEETARRKTESDAAKTKAKEEAEKRAKDEALKAFQARQSAAKPAIPAAQPPQAAQAAQPQQGPTSQSTIQRAPAALITLQSERDSLHKRYLDLHQHLKQMREFVVTEGKKIPALKQKLGDWRRQIYKSMGQLTTDKSKNRKPLSEIQRTLQESLQFAQPSVDVGPFLISQDAPQNATLQMSGPFIYLLNIFAKSIISQFISEQSNKSKSADPVGVAAVTIFATPVFKLANEVPLIDILLAKFHKTCPVLFGISGDQNTPKGRTRIGWQLADGAWVPEQRHIERQSGLAAGYAALSLRDFSKSKNTNPFPNAYYWRAVSCIVNTPPAEIQPTHFVVLKGLIDGFVPRFIGFYGQAAMAALRIALVEFPAKAQGKAKVAAGQMTVLEEVLQRDLRVSFRGGS